MNYSVGQVLYVVFKRETKVVPVLVIEEIVRKTREGVNVDYVVQVGSANTKETKLNLTALEGEVFETPSSVVDALTSRAHKTIAKLVDVAVEKASAWYKQEQTDLMKNNQLNDTYVAASDSEDMSVVLPDGTVARLSGTPQVA